MKEYEPKWMQDPLLRFWYEKMQEKKMFANEKTKEGN